MSYNFSIARYHWLTDSGPREASFRPDDGTRRHVYPIPPEIGEGWLDLVALGLGITLYRAVHRFRPAAAGQLVTLIEAEVDYEGPNFAIQAVFGGHICHWEQSPRAELIYGPGQALVRHTERLALVAKADGSVDSEVVGLSISDAQLANLLGESEAEQLRGALGVAASPSVAIRRLPAARAALLRRVGTPDATGDLQILQAQARLLGFLAALADDLGVSDGPSSPDADRRATLRALHDRLLQLEGKLPRLDELAAEYHLSARRLNALFISEYGAPIHGFITTQRLLQAHEAVRTTDIPLKALAHRLGYSHVNHFISAFRRQFGCTPGSLRRDAPAAPEAER
jgi:AraC-like DNA-binding protein